MAGFLSGEGREWTGIVEGVGEWHDNYEVLPCLTYSASMMERSATLRSYVLLAIANLVWALDYPLYKMALPHYLSPYALSSMALIFAGLACLVSFAFVRGEKVARGDYWKLALAGVLIGLIKKSCFMVSMSLTSPIDGSIISSVGPVLVLLISVLFAIDRITPMKLFGMLLGLAGTVMIVLVTRHRGDGSDRVAGNLVMLGGMVASSFYYVWIKGLVNKYKPLTILRWVYIFAALFALPVGVDTIPKVDFSAMHAGGALLVAYLILAPTLVPNFFVIASTRFVSPTVVSMYGYMQPVIATMLSVMLGQDRLSWGQVAAGLIIFVGVYFVIRSYQTPVSPVHHIR